MNKEQMLRAQRQQRATWLELDDPPRRALAIRRPAEDRVHSRRDVIGNKDAGIESLPQMRKIASEVVIGWRNFTEADLLGKEIGGDSPQDFDPEIFAEWVDDKPKELVEIAGKAVSAFIEHRDKKAAAEKN